MPDAVVDVLIPAYNASATIRSAVESIQNQTVRGIRILVVDDGSSDDTAAVVASMAESDPRIELLRKPNGGIVDALNLSLARCRAELLARHDGDDLALPDRFAKQVAYLRANPDCAAVGGATRHIDEAGRPLGGIERLMPPELADPLWVPQKEPYIMHPFLMARRELVQDVGGYRHAFHSEDTDLYWRLSERGRLHNLHDVLGDYRVHPHSISGKSVVNGRISALNSQLSGLSALRRRAGQPDMDFKKEALQEYQAAGSLEGLVRLGKRGLSAGEADRLEASVAAKMLDLSSYRPFELDRDDCRFIRRSLRRHAGLPTPENRSNLQRMRAGTAARLLRAGLAREALDLVELALLPPFLARLAMRALVPLSIRKRLPLRAGRGPVLK